MENIADFGVVLDVGESHFGAAFGGEIIHYRMDYGRILLNGLDFKGFDGAI